MEVSSQLHIPSGLPPENNKNGHGNTAVTSAKTDIKMILITDCTIHKEIPTRCNNVSKFYYSILIRSSTCFGRHTAHHQEPKTALAASGFAYVEGCWMCGCWTLTATGNHTSNNLPRMQNQRLLVQF